MNNTPIWATVLTVGAAAAAAILSGLTLWLTGRRENRAWIRSSLEHAFVNFLVGVYDNREAAKNIAIIQKGGVVNKSEADWKVQADSSRAMMQSSLSRIRILSTEELVGCSSVLLKMLDDQMDLLVAKKNLEGFLAARGPESLEHRNFVAKRDEFVGKAQAHLGVKR